MADSFLGEIRIVGFAYAPEDWAYCNGSAIPVSQTALFAVLGSTYGYTPGPNPPTTATFNLPNIQGRTVIGAGNGPNLTPRPLGSNTGDDETVQLDTTTMPTHQHALNYSITSNQFAVAVPASDGTSWISRLRNAAGTQTLSAFSKAPAPGALLSSQTLSAAGGSTDGVDAHENRQPYLVLSFIISLNGAFPPHS